MSNNGKISINKVNYNIGEGLSSRISIMRGILTLMVVNIHSINLVVHFQNENVSWGNALWIENIECLFSEVISRVAVPAFFFISALLLYRKDFSWIENIRKKVHTLVIPYLIVNSLWIIIYFVLQSIPALSPFFTMDGYIIRKWNIMGWLKGYGIFSSPLVAPLWFIRDLFVLNVLSKIIKKTLECAPKLFLVVVLLFWILPFSTLIFCLDKQAICFWCLGFLCVHFKFDLLSLDKIKRIWLVIFYFAFVLADIVFKGSELNWIFHNFGILVGLVFWFVFCAKINTCVIRKIILVISEYSFGIYLFHQLTLNCINKVYARIVPPSSLSQLLGYFFIPAVVIMGCIALSIFMKRYMPHAYCVLYGKKLQLLKERAK